MRCFQLLFDGQESVGNTPIEQVTSKQLYSMGLLLESGCWAGLWALCSDLPEQCCLLHFCGINEVVSLHSCRRDSQGGQALILTKHASFFMFGSILINRTMFKREIQSKKSAPSPTNTSVPVPRALHCSALAKEQL